MTRRTLLKLFGIAPLAAVAAKVLPKAEPKKVLVEALKKTDCLIQRGPSNVLYGQPVKAHIVDVGQKNGKPMIPATFEESDDGKNFTEIKDLCLRKRYFRQKGLGQGQSSDLVVTFWV